MSEFRTDKSGQTGAEKAKDALLARREQLCRKPARPPKSLQPTPEAAKSKIMRLRRKQRALIQKSKRTPSAGK